MKTREKLIRVLLPLVEIYQLLETKELPYLVGWILKNNKVPKDLCGTYFRKKLLVGNGKINKKIREIKISKTHVEVFLEYEVRPSISYFR